MNYYEELLENISKLIDDKNYEMARSLINDELNLAYVPRDIEIKLNDYLSEINEATRVYKSLTDEDIVNYLYLDNEHQLLAVDELNKKNLRDYIDVCNEYLKKGSYKNAKALLIDSLIRQEINFDFNYVNNSLLLIFNPSKLVTIENTDGFISANKYLTDTYMKEPSMLKISMDLLYKECLLYLPKQANEKEGIICAKKIVNYINDAFSAK